MIRSVLAFNLLRSYDRVPHHTKAACIAALQRSVLAADALLNLEKPLTAISSV
jgi:hypothetical protein